MLNLQITSNALSQSVTRQWPRYQCAMFTRLPRMISGGLLCLAGIGCGSDNTGPVPQDLATAYWTLQLNHHAITMALQAPYNTVQLTGTPLTLAGTSVPEAGRVQYSTTDSTIAVDSLGRITARYATLGQSAQVVANLTVKGLTLADTAFVQVDSFPLAHPLTTFSIHPQGTTCRQSSYDSPFTLPVYAVDAASDTLRNTHISNMPVYYTSSNTTIAIIDRNYGFVNANGPGTVLFTATALVNGVAQRDTLSYIFDPSHTDTILTNVQHGAGSALPTLTFVPSTITVGAGWHVQLINPTLDSVDVVFADSPPGINEIVVGHYAAADTAHTGPVIPGTQYNEIFFDARTYEYHSDRFGQSGTIRVQCGYQGN